MADDDYTVTIKVLTEEVGNTLKYFQQLTQVMIDLTGSVNQLTGAITNLNTKAVGLQSTTVDAGKGMKNFNNDVINTVFKLNEYKDIVSKLGPENKKLKGDLTRVFSSGDKSTFTNRLQKVNEEIQSSTEFTKKQKKEFDQLTTVGIKAINGLSDKSSSFAEVNKKVSESIPDPSAWKTYQKLIPTLSKMGVSANYVFGKAFDPNQINSVNNSVNKLKEISAQTGVPIENLSQIIPNLSKVIKTANGDIDLMAIAEKQLSSYSELSGPKQAQLTKVMRSMGVDITPVISKLEELNISTKDAFGGKFNLTKFNTVKDNLYTIDSLCSTTGLSLTEFGKLFPDVAKNVGKAGFNFNMFDQLVEKSRTAMSMSSDEWSSFKKAVESSGTPIKTFMKGAYDMTYGMDSLAISLREFRGEQGPVGMAINRLGQQLFWVGLGTMFLYISMQGIITRGKQIRQSLLGIVQAEASLQDQQEDLRDTIDEYGAGSKEATRATRDIKIQEMQLENQMANMNDAVRQQSQTWMMFLLSLGSQSINAGTQLATSFGMMSGVMAQTELQMMSLNKQQMIYWLEQKLLNDEIDDETFLRYANMAGIQATIAGRVTEGPMTSMTTMLHKMLTEVLKKERIAYMALYAGMSMGATLALSLAMEFAMTAYETANMNAELEKTNKELGIMDSVLTKHSVVPSLENMNAQVGMANKSYGELNTELATSNRYMQGISDINSARGNGMIGSSSSKTNNVNINIDVSGGSSGDIASAVRNELIKGLGRVGLA